MSPCEKGVDLGCANVLIASSVDQWPWGVIYEAVCVWSHIQM